MVPGKRTTNGNEYTESAARTGGRFKGKTAQKAFSRIEDVAGVLSGGSDGDLSTDQRVRTDSPGRPSLNGQGMMITPTDEMRRVVEVMAACGDTEADIAKAVGMARNSLRKYYKEELAAGQVKAHAAVKVALFEMATSGKCPAATFFWLKTRCKWKEVHDVDENAAPPNYPSIVFAPITFPPEEEDDRAP
ncbi:MAG: hypothetical protein ACR2HJ_06510 [Fimbriimonadales bacterium]